MTPQGAITPLSEHVKCRSAERKFAILRTCKMETKDICKMIN